jgi:hypothetical protein
MIVKVYELGTNKIREKRLVAILRNVTEIIEDNKGWMVIQDDDKGYHLKSQYDIVVE